MAQKLQAKGGKGGNQWDDLADHDNVTKIYVRGGYDGIQYVKFDYVKSGNPQTGSMHGASGKGFTQLFEIDPNNEHLVSVEGSYDDASGVIQALQFKTNKKTSEVMGDDEKGTKFSLKVHGKKIIGFHGYAETHLNSLGAYFITAPPTKLEYQGGSGGSLWDDGPNYNGVRKVSVSLDNNEIRQISFDYDKGGLVEQRSHGENVGRREEFVVDFPTEYITSVEGTCDNVSNPTQNRVRSLVIKTSKGRTSPIFGNVAAIKFVLEYNGDALIGFHGRAAGALDAIGAYFSLPPPPPPKKLQAYGGSGGSPWDDGPNYNGVKKVSVSLDNNEIRQIRVDYDKGGLVERRAHGEDVGRHEEFVVDFPTEYITSVEGTCDNVSNPAQNRVRSLVIKTSKGRTSPIFGNAAAIKFVLENNGAALIGFHGRAAGALDAIGAYFLALDPSPAEKLQAKGGDGGTPWDDGVFDGVREIYVGQGQNGVAAVKFVYGKDSEVFEGKDHGIPTKLSYEEFKLDYPSEYITSVEGYFDKIYGSEGGVITMLKFKTNKQTSPTFGMESANSFVLGKEGYKIVGFHGNVSHELHKFGVHVVPITQ